MFRFIKDKSIDTIFCIVGLCKALFYIAIPIWILIIGLGLVYFVNEVLKYVSA